MPLPSLPVLLVSVMALTMAGAVDSRGEEPVNAWTPESLTYYAEDYAPANYLDNGEVTGLTVDSLRLMWKQMGVAEQRINIVPWARGYREVLQKPGSVLFTMSRTPERESLFKWIGPIFVAHHVLIARHGFDRPITSLADASDLDVAVVINDVTHLELLASKHPEAHISSVTTRKQLLEMLSRKRVDLILMSLSGFQQVVEREQYSTGDFHVVARVSSEGNFIAFHKETPDALIQRFQSALEQTRDHRQALLSKYNISESAYAVQ